MVEARRIELLSKQSPTRQRLQLFPSSYPKVSDGNKNSFGLAIVDSRQATSQYLSLSSFL